MTIKALCSERHQNKQTNKPSKLLASFLFSAPFYLKIFFKNFPKRNHEVLIVLLHFFIKIKMKLNSHFYVVAYK